MEDNKKMEESVLQLPTDGQLDDKTEAVLKKHDKESATRKLVDPVKKIFFIACVLISCYHLYTAAFGSPVTLVHRSLHVSMMLTLCFIMYPFSQNSDMEKPTFCDWILVALSLPLRCIFIRIIWELWSGPATQTRRI